MNKVILMGLVVSGLTVMSHNSHATQPPKPDPTPANVQGQAQGQAQGQVQGQAQGQTQKAYGGQGGQGGKGGAGGIGNGGAGGNAAGGNATGGNSSASSDQSVDNRGAGSNSNNYQQSGIPVSSAVAPSFAIGGCQWAVSGGIQFFGTGVSGGGAGMYEFCKSLMKASHFRNEGNRNTDVAKALECQDSSIRAAYKTAGQPCQEDMPRVAANGASPVVPVLAAQPALPPNCTTQTISGKTFVTCQ